SVFYYFNKNNSLAQEFDNSFSNKTFFLNLSYDILNLSAIGSEKVSATVLLQILMTCAKIYKKRIAIIALRAKT
ncbi:TPA: hypothetical protein ACQ0EZ_002274, partial [Streptococcus agalactiae]